MSRSLSNNPARRPRVVIVGGGFGRPVDVTLIDRRNYHLFQPRLGSRPSFLPDRLPEPAARPHPWAISFLTRGRGARLMHAEHAARVPVGSRHDLRRAA